MNTISLETIALNGSARNGRGREGDIGESRDEGSHWDFRSCKSSDQGKQGIKAGSDDLIEKETKASDSGRPDVDGDTSTVTSDGVVLEGGKSVRWRW